MVSYSRFDKCRCLLGVTSDDLGVGGVFKMAVDHLLAEGEGATEALADDGNVLVEPLVVDVLGRLQLAVSDVCEGGGSQPAAA
jgi:hypothetical protein